MAGRSERFLHYTLSGLLAEEHVLVLDQGELVLSEWNGAQGVLVEQRRVTSGDAQLVRALCSDYPYWCPYHKLYAALAGSEDEEAVVERWRKRLARAATHGLWDEEVRPLRNSLSRLRAKLLLFDIDIVSMIDTGYLLARPGLKRGVRSLTKEVE